MRRFPGGLPGGLPCNPRLILWVQGCSPWCPLPATGMKRRTHSRCRGWEGGEGRQAAPWAPRLSVQCRGTERSTLSPPLLCTLHAVSSLILIGPHFTDEENEAQKGQSPCPRSHSKWKVGLPDLVLGSPCPHPSKAAALPSLHLCPSPARVPGAVHRRCPPPQPGSQALSIGGVTATSGKTVDCIVTHSRAEPQTIQPTTSPQRAVSRGTWTALWLPEAPPGGGRSAAGNGAAGQASWARRARGIPAGRPAGALGVHGPEQPHGGGRMGENNQPEGKRERRETEGGREGTDIAMWLWGNSSSDWITPIGTGVAIMFPGDISGTGDAGRKTIGCWTMCHKGAVSVPLTAHLLPLQLPQDGQWPQDELPPPTGQVGTPSPWALVSLVLPCRVT